MKVFILNIAALILLAGCAENSSSDSRSGGKSEASTRYLISENISDQKKRVEQLKKEINPFSNFTDAEFYLFNVNGFHDQERPSVPGSSSSDYKFVIKIDTMDIPKWTEGFIQKEIANYDYSWTRKLIAKRKDNWIITSTPLFLVRPESDVSILIYKKEGILFKSVVSL